MKKTIYCLTGYLFFLCIASGHAQSPPNLWVGFRVGADIAKLSFDPTDPKVNVSTKTGLLAGAELDYWFSDMFGVGIQIDYVQKGTNISDPTDASNTGSINLAHLQIPMLFKATFGSGSFKPIVFAGPAIGFKLSSTERITTGGKDTTIDIPDSDIVSTNLSLIVGAGVTYALNQTTVIFIDAAYDYGFTNLEANFGKTQFDTQKIYTRDIRICAGIRFGLGN